MGELAGTDMTSLEGDGRMDPAAEKSHVRAQLATVLGMQPLIQLHLISFAVGLGLAAASLWIDPANWTSPVYGILFVWFSPHQWAAILTGIALVKLASAMVYPKLTTTALILGNLLFVSWFASFAVAYFDRGLQPVSPLLALFCLWTVGEHLSVAYLLQRERKIRG